MNLSELARESIDIFKRDLICKHIDLGSKNRNPKKNAILSVDCELTTNAIMDPINQLILPICLNLVDQKNRNYQNWKFYCLDLRNADGIRNCILTHKGISVMIERFMEDKKEHFVFKIGVTHDK